jgi:Cu2+-exporting ATPase
MDDDLASLILAIRIARQAMAVVRQNTGIVVGPNLSAMVWAALVGLNPVAAVLINNGSAIVAEANGFQPLLGPPGWDKAEGRRSAATAQKTGGQPIALLPAAAAITSASDNDSTHDRAGAARANGANGDHGESIASTVPVSPDPAATHSGRRGKRKVQSTP